MSQNTEIEQLKKKFFDNPIYSYIKSKYPFRDYDLEFYLMCDWWQEERDRLPKTIGAFKEWISRTKMDEDLKFEYERVDKDIKWKENMKQMEEEKCIDAKPFLDKMRKELADKMGV